MREIVFCSAGSTPALHCATNFLSRLGTRVVPSPGPDVTHLLLPVPSLDPSGRVVGGGNLWHILSDLPKNVMIFGGNLQHSALEGYHTIDLLHNPTYLAKNAAITADCAVRIAASKLQTIFRDCPVLVIGWGRIGKCLVHLLDGMFAQVSVAARKETDRAMLEALGYRGICLQDIASQLHRFRVIFNTVPAEVITPEQADSMHTNCICIDLASQSGIGGPDVIWARGLPGKMAPEASGELIANTIQQMLVGRKV